MGKYDKVVKKNIFNFTTLKQDSFFELNNIIQENFENIKNYYNQSVPLNQVIQLIQHLKNDEDYVGTIEKELDRLNKKHNFLKDDIKYYIYTIGCATLTFIIVLTNKPESEIKSQAYSLYEKKNASYNDVWYERGIEGVCVDLNRKTSRLNAIINSKSTILDGETIFETLIDCLVFSAFLATAYQELK